MAKQVTNSSRNAEAHIPKTIECYSKGLQFLFLYLLRHHGQQEWKSIIKKCTDAVRKKINGTGLDTLRLQLERTTCGEGFRRLSDMVMSSKSLEANRIILKFLLSQRTRFDSAIVLAWLDVLNVDDPSKANLITNSLSPHFDRRQLIMEEIQQFGDEEIEKAFTNILQDVEKVSSIDLSASLYAIGIMTRWMGEDEKKQLESRSCVVDSLCGDRCEDRILSELSEHKFSYFLDQLTKVDPATSDFLELERFYNDLGSIVDKKRSERNEWQKNRNQICQEIELVRVKYKELMEYLDVTLSVDLTVEVSEKQIREYFDELCSALDEVANHREMRPVKGTRKAEIAWEQKLDELQNRVFSWSCPCAAFKEKGNDIESNSVLLTEMTSKEDLLCQNEELPLQNATASCNSNAYESLASIEEPIIERNENIQEYDVGLAKNNESEECVGKVTEPKNEIAMANPLENECIKGKNDDKYERLWKLLAADDVSGAYWLSWAQEQAESDTTVSSHLLAACFASRFIGPDSQRFADDLREIVRQEKTKENSTEIGLLRLSAAFPAVLMAPDSEMLDWIQIPHGLAFLHPLVKTLRDFGTRVGQLRPSDLIGLVNCREREEMLQTAKRRLCDQLESSKNRTIKFARATEVWNRLIGHSGELRVLCEQTLSCSIEVAGSKLKEWEKWQEQDYIIQRISYQDNQLTAGRLPGITGVAREQVKRYIAEIANDAVIYCKLAVAVKNSEVNSQDWIGQQVSNLRKELQEQIPTVINELRKNVRYHNAPSIYASAKIFETATKIVCNKLGVIIDTDEKGGSLSTDHVYLRDENMRVNDLLLMRLLLNPDFQLNALGAPSEEDIQMINTLDFEMKLLSPENAIYELVQKRDFRFIERLLHMVTDFSDQAEKKQFAENARTNCANLLQDKVLAVRGDVEQALIDGVIEDKEREELTATLNEVLQPRQVNYSEVEVRVDSVQEQVGQGRARRIEMLQSEWESLEQDLTKSNIDAKITKKLRTAISQALANGNTRVAEEYMLHIKEALDSGRTLDDKALSFMPEGKPKNILAQFIKESDRLMDALSQTSGVNSLIDALERGKTWHSLDNIGNMSGSAKEAARNALNSWRKLKQGGTGTQNLESHVESLFGFLGFQINGDAKVCIRRTNTGDNWIHCSAKMSAGGRAPVPQFGSQQGDNYDIFLLWERPSADVIGAWLRNLRLDNRNVIVVYLGRMSLRYRRTMRRISHERGFVIAVLDEVLLSFLCNEEAPFSPFFACALPFSCLNPYTPFKAGDVPPEMFFGRTKMAQSLQQSEGSCIVYGGRQLGKSALLRHVQRNFHNPRQNQFAHVEDIKGLGDPKTGRAIDEIWGKIWDTMQTNFNVISSRTAKPTDSDEQIKGIRAAMNKKHEVRVLLLFDEADHFLESDKDTNFKHIDHFRVLMQDTQHRLKVVFAGLHSVQRFQGIENQPLAHYGLPLCVGQLEAEAAQKLILEPFQSLGFEFSDTSILLQILSYTNHHPGLLQLFCHALLQNMLADSLGQDPPYLVTRERVEAVYRNQELRKQFADRFDWTLALDPRYEVVVRALILEQLGDDTGFTCRYSSSKILQIAQSWWLQGFNRIPVDEFRGLLDELCGLGVLLRDTDGRYRIKSPNIARMMGSREDIEMHLMEIIEKDLENPRVATDSFHVPIENCRPSYSPFSLAQERVMGNNTSGVTMVIGSRAAGCDQVKAAIRERAIPPHMLASGTAKFDELLKVHSRTEIQEWVDQFVSQHPKVQRLIIFKRIDEAKDNVVEMVRGAWRQCKNYSSRTIRIRFVFLLDEKALWNWYRLSSKERSSVGEEIDKIYLKPWNECAVGHRLLQEQKMDSRSVLREIMQVTGGWGLLIEELFRRADGTIDMEPIVKTLAEEIVLPEGELRKLFVEYSGSAVSAEGKAVLRKISENSDAIDRELIEEPAFVDLIADDEVMDEEFIRSTIEYYFDLGILSFAENDRLIVDPLHKQTRCTV